MSWLGAIKSELYIGALKLLGFLFLITYIPFMFIVPWFNGGWDYVHGVWHSWQSLNVGVLAFLASVIALYVSRYQSIEQRKREFEGAKAFLPYALSELCKYLTSSAMVLVSVFPQRSGRRDIKLDLECPLLPIEQFEVFKDCIKFAEVDVAKYLAKILNLLQVHHSRLEAICEANHLNEPYGRSCIYSVAETQALINNLYDFARSDAEFKNKELDWEDIRVSYRNLGVIFENINKLEEYSQKRLENIHITNASRGTVNA
ncbi:hypothetical protein ACPF4H_003617 [Vibrio cholerae]|nr:hypothetical protein [Vibrio cholerae]EGR0757221.1 hypothetical protein [Vibrio cholerae]EGR0820952.1 hypothetical protein [Vibrio cholerae]EJM7234097.1 hypothetical protein [Vibrio cholerae]